MATTPYLQWKLWMYYANIFGTMPPNGTPRESGYAVALAFGRNSIPDQNLQSMVCKKVYRPHVTAHLATIAYLNHEGFDPGKPNRHIANCIKNYVEDYRRPVAAQWELCIALFQIYGEQWVRSAINNSRLFCLWPRPNMNAYRSLHVLEDAYNVLSTVQPQRRPLLIAHDLHMPRVYMLARKLWTNPIIGFKTITRSFDAQSVQKQITSPLCWYGYEFRARAHHLLHHWV